MLNRPRAYDGVFKLLHWTVVALLLVQYGTKLVPWGSEDARNAWHVAVGPTILFVMLLRLLWRLFRPVPPAPRDLSPALQLLSRANHWALYVVAILLPVGGWVAASAYGVTPFLFGVIPLPHLVSKNEAFAEQVGTVHGAGALLLLLLIALHIAGALYHAVIRRDGVMQRMLPFGELGPP